MTIHRNPSDECQVERHIAPVFGDMFASLDSKMAEELAGIAIAQVAEAMQLAIEAE